MPRYKCKVDVVYPFTLEVNATTQEELHIKLLDYQYNLENAEDRILEIADIDKLPEIAALFTYPILPENASDRMKEAYKVMVEEIQLASEQSGIDDLLNQESKEKIRKQSDTTKITQRQYDDIQFIYSEYCKGRIGGVRTTQQLVELLNSKYGLNKSRSVYSKIWCGGVDRESLPKGE